MVGEPIMESIAHAVAAVGGRIYLSGGFNGVALGRMAALSVPSDPCLIFSSLEACNGSNASCVWCRASCLSADAAERCGQMRDRTMVLDKFLRNGDTVVIVCVCLGEL